MYQFVFKALKVLASTGGSIAEGLVPSQKVGIPDVHDEILVLPFMVLAEKIRKRQLTSEQVVLTFVERAKIVQIHLNAIIDERYDAAIEDAKAVDEFLRTTQLTEQELADTKFLLGLPFTVKDSIKVTGMKWTSGCYRRKNIVAPDDAPIVRNYREAGAIPIAITNVPELLLWLSSTNKLYGATNNPFDFTRISGGSSGGEAALMSAAGTPLSICTDIGGSIRMPAFYCGLFGHKPTHKVIDWTGTYPPIGDGLEEIFTFGPICRYAEELLPALRIMAGENFTLFKNIDKPVELSKLRVFYMEESDNDFAIQVEPYVRDAIQMAAQYFAEKFGAKVERANLTQLKHVALWYTCLFSNNQDLTKLLTENTYQISPFYELCKSMVGQSQFSLNALAVAMAQKTIQATKYSNFGEKLFDKADETLILARKEFNNLLGDDGVFISASLPRTAPSHYASVFETTNVCYPMMMNYLGAPTTQVPTGCFEGLPFGVQVSASPYNDRLTLAVAKELEIAFGGWQQPFQVSLMGSTIINTNIITNNCDTNNNE